eukprot:snap_masked-scaffold_37-processed-gene-1.5-mRNA-1 protein AED:0.11 eAED:0.11 QI:0/-1/0/1/-1/1/1/0/258
MEAFQSHFSQNQTSSYPLLNPYNLSPSFLLFTLLLKMFSQFILETVLLSILQYTNTPKLPSRTPPISKGLVSLSMKDYSFLAMNQFIELCFLFHLLSYAQSLDWTSPSLILLPMHLILIFLLDDFFYYFLHRAMHHPSIYSLIHKHHHRQSLPSRGYLDAGNEHPLEQILGLSCVFLAFEIINRFSSLHPLTLAAFMPIYATCAFLNHTPYDVKLFGYTVRAHEMHHRIPRCNYAQNTMLFDKLFGTFSEYKSGQKKL